MVSEEVWVVFALLLTDECEDEFRSATDSECLATPSSPCADHTEQATARAELVARPDLVRKNEKKLQGAKIVSVET